MKTYQWLKQRLLNDEPEVPFDAEPGDLTLLDADEYDAKRDVGDEDSQ